MSVTATALRHRSTVLFLMVVTLVLGFDAYRSLPRERYPDIQVPLVIVLVPFPGAAPADVENQIITPIERELVGLGGVDTVTSVSESGRGVVTVEFAVGTDIDAAMQKVRDRVDRAQADFPDAAEEPVLEEVNFADLPILQVHLSGDVGPVQLKRLAESLQDEIETIEGVLRVNVVGGREREIHVDVDPRRLEQYGLSLDDVTRAVRTGHVAMPGGEVDLGSQTLTVRVPGEVADPLAIGDFVVSTAGGAPVYVRDVAEVDFGFEARASYARIDGRESVALTIQKRLGANIIAIVDEAKARTKTSEAQWPAGVDATFLADQSRDIRLQLAELVNSILSGLLLVVVVLMFALGLRNALFVGLAIPFSMLLTFLVLRLMGASLNTVTLFALVLAVGMLVDNAVVVIENIYRHVQEGASRLQAAAQATDEVRAAITVSTLTTLGAFAPLLFWPGVIGDFMKYLPQTVSVALVMSLLVAFTVNPVLCSALMRRKVTKADAARPGRLTRWGEALARGYARLLTACLEHRGRALVVVLASFGLIVVLFGRFNPGVEYLPETEPNQIYVDVELPAGARLDAVDEVMRALEMDLASLDDVALMAASVGAGSQDSGFGAGAGARNLGRIVLELVPRGDRRQSSFVTLDAVRARTENIPGVRVDVEPPDDGVESGSPLEIEIAGDDFATLGAVAARSRALLRDIPGLVSLGDDFESARPEVVIQVERVAAARLGLTTADIASTVRTAINGTEAATFRRGDEETDITVRLAEASRSSLEDLRALRVVSDRGEAVPLDAVARIDRQAALVAIRHKDRARMVIVRGDVTEPKLAGPVRAEAQRRLAAEADWVPDGYALRFAGQAVEEQEATAFLGRAFLYAVLMVLALLVAKFDSFAIPIIVISSVLMSMVGVFLGLLVTGLPFGIIMTGVGVISLAGIVVNNAIVLLDYAEQLGARGLARRECVVTAGQRRLRPVLLTAVTTILGLLPLTTGVEIDFAHLTINAGGESSQYWRSMGASVIFGLAIATFLTLVFVPVLYDLLLEARERWGATRRSAHRSPEPTEP